MFNVYMCSMCTCVQRVHVFNVYMCSMCVGSFAAIFIMESMMDHAAKQIGMDAETFRRKNLYQQGQVFLIFQLQL